MIIKNGESEISSYPTWEIIEPNRKYLESVSFYPSSHFGIYREYLGRYMKVNRSVEFA